MADFSPNKIDLSKINDGKRYNDGDIPNAEGINAAIEASAYAQGESEQAKQAASGASESATAAQNAATSAAESATQSAGNSAAAQLAASQAQSSASASATAASQAAASASTAQSQASAAQNAAEAAQTAANTANSNATAAVNTANSAASTANAAKAASDTATEKVAELSEQIGEKQGTTVKINGVAQASVELTTATVGKSETLTEPFTVGKDTTTATTGYVKFASVRLPAAYRSASARFEVLDKNPVNAQTQMCGVEVVVRNTSETSETVVPQLLYGSSAYLSKIYACVKKGSYPVIVDLYFNITSDNPQDSIACIKPLFTFGRTIVGVEFTFITDNVVVSALPTDTTNTQLSTVRVLVTEAADSEKLNGKAASDIFESDGVTAKKATEATKTTKSLFFMGGNGSQRYEYNGSAQIVVRPEMQRYTSSVSSNAYFFSTFFNNIISTIGNSFAVIRGDFEYNGGYYVYVIQGLGTYIGTAQKMVFGEDFVVDTPLPFLVTNNKVMLNNVNISTNYVSIGTYYNIRYPSI